MTLRYICCLIWLATGIFGCTSTRGGRKEVSTDSNPVAEDRPALTRRSSAEREPKEHQSSLTAIGRASPSTQGIEDEGSAEEFVPVSAQVPNPLTDRRPVNEPDVGTAVVTVTTESESKAEKVNSAYTLSLASVLNLADDQNPNVAAARERINEAYSRVERAQTLWLPSLRAGVNYNHHEGAIQDVAGNVFNTNRSALGGGFGTNYVGAASPTVPGLVAQFHLTDAVFQPKIAAHQASARQFGATAARNDTLRDAAVAYLELVRAEHALAIAEEALVNTEKLAKLTRQYAETGEGLQSDHQRSEAELALRQDDVVARQEGVQVASARLAQVLHADPSVVIQSGEPAVVPLEIVALDGGPASYVATGLSRRPELSEQKHLVCEAVERLRREKYAPLIPSVLLGMSYGGMGGGLGNSIINTNERWDADAIAYWEVRNLGMGERAAQGETSSLQRQALMREVAIMDRVSREVVEAHAQVTKRQQRIELTQRGVAAAQKSYLLNIDRIENAQGLPIETLQAIQALANARRAYLNAVVDYNIAQFELSRAIGWFVEY